VLLSSHLLAEMAQLADDVVVIHRGRLVTQAPVADLIGDGARARVRSPEASRLADLLVANGIDARADGPALTVVGAELAAVGALAFDAGIPVYELTGDEPSLEDVFLELTTEEEGSR
jgi:ABC-2 type transport system ATP-binding protein